MAATIAGWVWLEGLSAVQRGNLRARLTIYPRKTTDIAGAKTPEPLLLYREDGDRFAVPRGFWATENTGRHAERIAVTYGQPMRALATRWTAEGPFAEQAEIVDVLHRKLTAQPWGGGLLEANAGTGKTNVAIELARRLGCATMILVHKEFLLQQWQRRIEALMPGARVGVVQQDRCEWEGVDFCIGLMQSLVRDDGAGGKYDQRLYSEGFGFLVIDECHRLPSATFSGLAPRFHAAYRCGLSATFRRKDGAEDVFYYQIGSVLYTARSQAMLPKLRVVRSAASVRAIRRGRYQVAVDKLNSAQVISQLADDTVRQRSLVDQVLRAAQAGRKILVVSERLEQLRDMRAAVAAALPTVTQGVYTGQWFVRERGSKMRDVSQADLDAAQPSQVLWGTKQLIEEGFDIPACDVLVLATPISDAEQIVGRVQRWCAPQPEKCARLCPWRAGTCVGKPDPVVIDVIDVNVPKVLGKWRRRRKLYREMGMGMEGVPT